MKRSLQILGGTILAGWLVMAHFVLAPEMALSIASSDSLSNKGYISWCRANERSKINTAISAMRSDVQSKFAEKEAGVFGLQLFGALLNQSFGDRNYQNYIDENGTNPFDALTGGALSKAPGAIGNIVASNKHEAMAEIEQLQNGLIAQAVVSCDCAYQAAFSETHLDWTVWVASAKLIQPTAINQINFRSLAQSKHSICRA